MTASSLRPRAADGLVMTVAHRLTQRDRSILTMLFRHRVFTTDQLAEMYFDNLNTAQHRLTTLYKLRLVDRFQPLDHRYASLPYHYVLGDLGAMVVAAERGEGPDRSRWRADKALATVNCHRLDVACGRAAAVVLLRDRHLRLLGRSQPSALPCNVRRARGLDRDRRRVRDARFAPQTGTAPRAHVAPPA